jgi:hypothetical protein
MSRQQAGWKPALQNRGAAAEHPDDLSQKQLALTKRRA